jgi:GNAT superfamily N-acetyltransferase
MQIRAAVESDVPRLLSLVRRYWEFEDIGGFAALRVELLLQRLLQERALGEIWVAAREDELCGYLIAVCVVSFEHQGLMAEIDEFFVVPQQRGTGVGAQLLRAAEGSLAARGCVRLQLQLNVANAGARQFYERRGYRGRAGYQLLDKALG